MAELQTESVETLGTLVLVLDIVEVVGDTDRQGAVFVKNWNFELDACKTF